jgi:hypothetical protein
MSSAKGCGRRETLEAGFRLPVGPGGRFIGQAKRDEKETEQKEGLLRSREVTLTDSERPGRLPQEG